MTDRDSVLFEKTRIGDCEIANRVVMAPMTRSRADPGTAVPIPETAGYYAQRSSAGLIISEGVVISREATGYVGVPGIYDTEQMRAWREVTDAVHAEGGRIFAQLWHVGRISHPDLLGGDLPLAPSAIDPKFFAFTEGGKVDTVTPRAMTLGDISRTVADFVRAARNAIAAGFDGIELHAANGYLIHEFLAPSANRRDDAYGGSREKRVRFLFEVLDAVIDAIGRGRTAVRLNPVMDGVAGIVLDDELKETFDDVVERLSWYGLAFLEVAVLTFDPDRDSIALTVETARHFRRLYRGNLVINGSLTREAAIDLLNEGVADLVSFGKPFVANPDLVRRLFERIALAEPDPGTFYEGGLRGYIDYPAATGITVAA